MTPIKQFANIHSLWLPALVAALASCRHQTAPSTSAQLPPTVQVTEAPALPQGRGSHAAGVVRGQIIVAGGSSWNQDGTVKTYHADSTVYDQGRWSPGPTLPIPFAEGAYACDGSALYLAGGLRGAEQPNDQVYRITRQNDRWSIQTLMPLPHVLFGNAGAILNNTFYVACGMVDAKSINELWSLDLSSDSPRWTRKAFLPGPGRSYPALVSCGGSLYLLGGLMDQPADFHLRTQNDVYRYDPDADHWTLLGKLPIAGYCWSADAVDDSHLLITGRADGQIHDDIWIVDLKTLQAEQIGKTLTPTTCAALIATSPNQWWLIGGEPDANRHRTSRISVIDLQTTGK